jgi:hypothetical protein
MTIEVRLTSEEWILLRQHLFQNSKEHAAFAFCKLARGDDGVALVSEDLYLAVRSDFELQLEYHITLSDETLARLIKKAWDHDHCIVEFHSHPKSPGGVSFSPSDLDGLADVVPYIGWRLRGRPYAAVVVGLKEIDALAWVDDFTVPQRLDVVRVGNDKLLPSQITISELEGDYGEIQ